MIEDMGKGVERSTTHVRPQERDASGKGGGKRYFWRLFVEKLGSTILDQNTY
jgi:hypothetical protein